VYSQTLFIFIVFLTYTFPLIGPHWKKYISVGCRDYDDHSMETLHPIIPLGKSQTRKIKQCLQNVQVLKLAQCATFQNCEHVTVYLVPHNLATFAIRTHLKIIGT
jgi:hypothetical protein